MSLSESIPLCVDLDGTFARNDSTWDMLAMYALSEPLGAVRIGAWAVGGKSRLKHRLWERSPLDVATIPINEHVVAFLEQESRGRPVYLVSGAPQAVVDRVLVRYPVFTGGFGSSESINLVGARKAHLLIDRFGPKRFDYVGDAPIDIPIWQAARRAWVVGATPRQRRQYAAKRIELESLDSPRCEESASTFSAMLRLSHSLKNVLAFVPLIAAHRWQDSAAWLTVLQVFVALSIGASISYICNDLRDLNADRAHPEKRNRPLAAGRVSVRTALIVASILTIAWTMSLAFLGRAAAIASIAQVVGSLAYSAGVKGVPILDVIWLGLLFGNRVLVGGLAIDVVPSEWLIGFTLFFFFGVATLKRYSELRRATHLGEVPGRGYRATDHEMVRISGYASSLIAVVVLAVYIAQPEVSVMYSRPTLLWPLCIVQFYWSTRAWLLASRGEAFEDLVQFVVHDRTTWLCGLASLITIVASA